MTKAERQVLEAELTPEERAKRERLRAHKREYAQANKEQIRARHHEYYLANREYLCARQRERQPEYYQANRKVLIAYQHEYRHNNAELVRAKGREYSRSHTEAKRSYNHNYQRSRIEQMRALWRKNDLTRRARKKGIYSENIDPIEIFSRDKWRCKRCRCMTPRELMGTNEANAPTLDHVIPLALGGPHTKANTQCLCRTCNRAKWAKYEGQLAFA